MIYAVESETASGWCLPEAQLAISGIQVARAIYDTLVQPDASGEMAPMLAESVEPNDTFDEWTILLRQGVTFHDGSPFSADDTTATLAGPPRRWPSAAKLTCIM